ncbi:peptide chain release factor N(5)-glutamine methyltransferase [Algoriphagus sp. H41]|uniref:Release factor glutamine methyltransferase n=1 Tax=Algoriphagus oliviformis TaxID=2811231 RepID=A0ABS3CBR8_9BACT|nr:peptide chain release factor N(5)-glutamine methyltransferase [Algoriphagus oliviformis]MBN7813625.1 peptide chain release factor N(5)-glutamine methyltransferase [Algoriphagus oliviformis]
MSISLLDFSKKLSSELLDLYPETEAQSLAAWLIEHHFGLKRIDGPTLLEEEKVPEKLQEDLARLKSGEPIQYILGKGPFYGREFLVTSATLIPRNETEELVHLIIKENKAANLRILDIGTGTGCIPISLALEMNSPDVYALDISEPALAIARKNAEVLGANVRFELCDILTQTPTVGKLDILVSNPPYVLESDKSQMHQNVLAHEPWTALFVTDEDPLIFYRVIAEKGRKILKPGGKLYFEIHESKGELVHALLASTGYVDVRILQDLNGKDRMCAAIWG